MVKIRIWKSPECDYRAIFVLNDKLYRQDKKSLKIDFRGLKIDVPQSRLFLMVWAFCFHGLCIASAGQGECHCIFNALELYDIRIVDAMR